MVDQNVAPVAKALFVRLTASDGKADEVEAFLRDGLAAVMEEDVQPPGTQFALDIVTLRSSTLFLTTRGGSPTSRAR